MKRDLIRFLILILLFFSMTSLITKSIEITASDSPKMKTKEIYNTNVGISEADTFELPFVERNRMFSEGDWFYPNRNLETGVIRPQTHTITNLGQGSRWNLTVGLVAGYNVKSDFVYSNPATDGNCDLYLYPPSVNISDPGTDLETTYVAVSTLAEGIDESITFLVPEDGNYTVVVFHLNPPLSTQPLATGTLSIRQNIDDVVLNFYTEGEVSPGVMSNYSDFYWLYPFTANPIYASIPSSTDSDFLSMIEASSGTYEEASGSPGEDLYIENETFSGDIGVSYHSQAGRGFVSLWSTSSGLDYQIVPLQLPSRPYTQTDLKLQFYLFVTEESDVDIEPVLEINGEPSEEAPDYTTEVLSDYLSLISISLSSDELDQGSVSLKLTTDYSFDFQINGFGNYYFVQSEAVYYQSKWNTTQNSTLIYAQINENETTIEDVTFNFENTASEWQSIPMTWIEPTIYAANTSSNQINVTTIEWNLTIVETASISTEPIIQMSTSAAETELDLATSIKTTVTGTINVYGISALNAAVGFTTVIPTLNTSGITFGEITAGSSKVFGLDITFDESGNFELTITLTADNHPDIVKLIQFSVTDSTPVETTTTTDVTTTTTTTTASQATPGFTIFSLIIIGFLLVPLRRKTR